MNKSENKKIHILLVDDDLEICELLKTYLGNHSYQVTLCHNGNELRKQLALSASHFDLIILDILLPGEDGFSLCAEIRAQFTTPIIMLTAINSEADRVAGLEIGADDYLAKPFSARELLARIKALLRRSQFADVKVKAHKMLPMPLIRFSKWTLDQNKRCLITENDVIIALSTGEYELLVAFIEHPSRVLSRDQLLQLTRNRDAGPFDRSIDVQVGRLRRKIEDDPKNPIIILTVRGGGYQFTARVETIG